MSESRYRSRSPHRSSTDHSHSRSHKHKHHHRTRSRSPQRNSTRSSHRPSPAITPRALPLNALPLTKHDLSAYRPLFALYLDIQKQIDIDGLPEDEVKGRWKSFVKKWNAGDLAEGWYDTQTFEKARQGTFGAQQQASHSSRDNNARNSAKHTAQHQAEDLEDFGPSPPPKSVNVTPGQGQGHSQSAEAGPSMPSMSDLTARNEEAREDADTAREEYISNIRAERKADRRLQKEHLDDLAPRAEPGTRDRQLEKKREIATSNRAFAAAKDASGDVELRDADVMGDADSLGELKRMKELEQRKRTERDIRREEILRTRVAEREERVKGMREKEAKTMEMLKSIARTRFGGGEGEV